MKHKMKNLSLFQKFVLVLILFVFLPLLILWGTGYQTFTSIMHDTVVETNLHTLHQVQNNIDDIHEEINDVLMKTSLHPDIQNILKNTTESEWESYQESRTFVEYIRLLLAGNPEIHRISILNYHGKRLDSIGRFLNIPKLPEQDIYHYMLKEVKKNSMTISPIYQNNTGETIISFGKLVLDINSGKAIGVIIVDLNLEVMNQGLNSVKLLNSGSVVLIDQYGQYIYHPTKEVGDLADDFYLENNETYFTNEYKGNSFLFLKESNTLTNWTLYGIVPYEEVLTKIKPIQYKFFIFLFFLIIVVMILSISVRKEFVKPIRKLQHLMQTVQHGDLDVKANFNRNDELGILAQHFDLMIERISMLIEKVYQVELNESLAQLYQKQAELEALQAKISPHFLYNTLNSISWFAYQKGVREIQITIDSLSSMLRYSLGNPSKFVTIEEEINYLKMYSEIMNFRYSDMIQFHYDVPEDLKEVILPRLSLQPIVENAIKHGFEGIFGGERIIVRVQKVNQHVIIEIEDNGMGMSMDDLQSLKNKLEYRIAEKVDYIQGHEGGIGLDNVQQRLKLWFGHEYGVAIESEKTGTIVKVKIPNLEQVHEVKGMSEQNR